MMNKNIIINGDAIVEMNKLEPSSIDLIFADPPYWLRIEHTLQRTDGTAFDGCDDDWDKFSSLDAYKQFTTDWLRACYRILKPNGSIWVMGGMQCIYMIGAIMQELGYWFINDVIWQKSNPTPNFMGTRLNNSHETLIWATKSKQSKYTFNYKTAKELNSDTVSPEDFQAGVRKQLGSIWKFPLCNGNERLKDDDNNKLHSTQKPQRILERIVAISSNIGDVVLDPFGGTMTAGAAAKKLGRDYIMIENDKTYCEYGQRRLDSVQYVDDEIATAALDVKPIRVSMVAMIEAGYLYIGEAFHFRWGGEIATLRSDGKLLYNGEILDMHTCAAKVRNTKAKRLNGYDYWYVMRDGERKSIAAIREEYRQSIAKGV